MGKWDPLPALLREELKQRAEEGCDITGFPEELEAAGEDPARLEMLYEALMALPIRPDFPYQEPSGLEEIRAQRLVGPRRLPDELSDEQWQDRFLGAWLGRCAGCALGKPVEAGPFMSGAAGNPGWKNVYLWFKEAGAWPIDGYVPGQSKAKETLGIELSPKSRASERENIRFMQSDDDIRYTVLGLILLEEKGLDYDTWDVGALWHNRLAYNQVFTAEDRTYVNLARAVSGVRGRRPEDWHERLEWARMYHNPYREWIGAQIRADGWAYAAAGYPELAAELAWRDASLSHVKNGIYGEMFVAAMIATAFVEPSMEKIIAAGLSEIPSRSRLAEAIMKAVEIAHTSTSQLELVERVWNAFSRYHPVHTINNAALVAAALIWARDDFEQAITTAVLGGWDTDCNGATVGSIMGARLGASALPAKWIEPLHDTLYADLYGFHPIAISECARRSHAVFLKNVKQRA